MKKYILYKEILPIITVITMMATSLGAAEGAKTEIHFGNSNETKMTTQNPKDNEGLEVGEVTDEEVIQTLQKSDVEEVIKSEEDVKREIKEIYDKFGKIPKNSDYVVVGIIAGYRIANYKNLPDDFIDNPIDPKYLPKDAVKRVNAYMKKYAGDDPLNLTLLYAMKDMLGYILDSNIESVSWTGEFNASFSWLCYDEEYRGLIDSLTIQSMAAWNELLSGVFAGDAYCGYIDMVKKTRELIEDSFQLEYYDLSVIADATSLTSSNMLYQKRHDDFYDGPFVKERYIGPDPTGKDSLLVSTYHELMDITLNVKCPDIVDAEKII